MSFLSINYQDVNISLFESWNEDGIKNGFIGKSLDFSDINLKESIIKLEVALGVDNVVVLNQVHGDVISIIEDDSILKEIDFSNKDNQIEADAILLRKASLNNNILYGIKTADCVPLLIKSDKTYALVHAGWKGLANKILTKTISVIRETDSSLISILVGPHAINGYQVGSEVLNMIGEHVVAEKVGEKHSLNMFDTLKNEIKNVKDVEFKLLDVCTLGCSDFHSYRLQGDKSGRNLAFLVP